MHTWIHTSLRVKIVELQLYMHTCTLCTRTQVLRTYFHIRIIFVQQGQCSFIHSYIHTYIHKLIVLMRRNRRCLIKNNVYLVLFDTYLHTYIYMHVCIYEYKYACVRMHLFMMYIRMSISVYVCMYVCM